MRTINNPLTGQIISLVCDTWGITRADLTGRSHRRPLPWARSQMCEYLRRYAGHDSVSCAAILHVDPDTVLGYNKRYPHNLRTYTPFYNNDKTIHTAIKALIKPQPTH